MQIRLLDAAGARQLYESRMARDFPPGELKPFAAVQELLAAGLYEPLTFADDAGSVLAYAWQVVLPGQQAGLVDYFAVRSAPGRCTCCRPIMRPAWRRCCWSVSTPPKPRTQPSQGGASGSICGPGQGPPRWKAGCSVRGTVFCSCPAARPSCQTAH